MKTVKPVDGGVPERVKDDVAETRVKSGKYVYCKKTEWKKVRDANKPKPAAVDVKKEQMKERVKEARKENLKRYSQGK